MKIKRNLTGIIAMAAAAAIAMMAGHLPGRGAGGDWLAEAAAAAPSPGGTAHNETRAAEALAEAADLEALVARFEDSSGGYYDEKGFSSNRYEYTEEELKALATVIHLESRNQPYDCMLAVGNVVMNRVLSPGYPGDTILEVVSAPNQFCYDPKVTPNAKSMQAARDILDNEVWVVPQNTYFFRANKSTADWYKHVYWKHLGNTAFYRNHYSGRFDGDAIPSRLFERVYEWPQYGCEPGERVAELQKMLAALGYKTAADGYFGESTKKALTSFQKAAGLKADGVAGQETLQAILSKYGAARYLSNK